MERIEDLTQWNAKVAVAMTVIPGRLRNLVSQASVPGGGFKSANALVEEITVSDGMLIHQDTDQLLQGQSLAVVTRIHL